MIRTLLSASRRCCPASARAAATPAAPAPAAAPAAATPARSPPPAAGGTEDRRSRRRGRLPAHAAPADPLPFRQPVHRRRRRQAARHRSAEPAGSARRVYFGIRWDGSVSDALVNDKSGVDAFDKAAVAAVRGETRSLPAAARRAVRRRRGRSFPLGVLPRPQPVRRGRRPPAGGAARGGAAPPVRSGPDQGGAAARRSRPARPARATRSAVFAQAWLERPPGRIRPPTRARRRRCSATATSGAGQGASRGSSRRSRGKETAADRRARRWARTRAAAAPS